MRLIRKAASSVFSSKAASSRRPRLPDEEEASEAEEAKEWAVKVEKAVNIPEAWKAVEKAFRVEAEDNTVVSGLKGAKPQSRSISGSRWTWLPLPVNRLHSIEFR